MACEGALIVVDASQGVKAQTVANLYMAIEHNLELLPIINKIDLPSADIKRTQEAIDAELGLDPFAAIPISARNGTNIDQVLEGIVEKLPPPQGDPDAPLKALVFDAHFDKFRGVILQCRVMEGTLKPRNIIHFMHANRDFKVDEVGYNQFQLVPRQQLSEAKWATSSPASRACRTLKSATRSRCSIDKPPSRSPAIRRHGRSCSRRSTRWIRASTRNSRRLWRNSDQRRRAHFQRQLGGMGFGFRCGFLGLLHLDVIQERLQRKFDIGLVISAPSVKYKLKLHNGSEMEVDNPTYWPDPMSIESASEPYIKASIITPEEYVGGVMELCREHRSESQTMDYLSAKRMEVTSVMPLGEVLFDFYGKLKMLTRGYRSFDYKPIEYRQTDVVKVDILVNKEPVDTLSYLVHRDNARTRRVALLRTVGQGNSPASIQDSDSGRHWRRDHRANHGRPVSEGRHRRNSTAAT